MKIHKRSNNFTLHLWLLRFHSLCANSASTKCPFLEGFWALSPLNMAQYYQNSHQYSSKQKTLFENLCMIWVFIYRKWTVPKLALLVKLPPNIPLKTAEIEKIRSSVEKLQLLGYPNISISKLYLLFPFRKKYGYFLQYLGYFFPENRAWSQVKQGCRGGGS